MSDYNSIKNSVTKHLRVLKANDAIELIPEFIQLAELNAYRVLRIPPMENVVDGLTEEDEGYIGVPYDLIETKAVILLNGLIPRELEYRPYGEIQAGDTNRTGDPRFYTRMLDRIIFFPVPAERALIRLYYYRQLESLTSEKPDNYLSNQAPDLLIYGALREAAPYLNMGSIPPEAVNNFLQIWETKFQTAMGALEAMKDNDLNGSRLQIRGAL